MATYSFHRLIMGKEEIVSLGISDSEFRNIPVPVRFRIRQTDLFREKRKKIGPKIYLFSVE